MTTTTDRQSLQRDRIRSGAGFMAALDQSGGSTPKALASYGVDADAWSSDDEMFDLVHAMRTRLITSDAFASGKVLGAILFEQTMDRSVMGRPTADFLWEERQIVPFVKCDAGLAPEQDGMQLLAPNPGLHELLERAVAAHIYGTKMRSVIHRADADGIESVVGQQFAIGREILDAGLVPIIEPEVSITAPDKAEAEELLEQSLRRHIDAHAGGAVMLKLTLPDRPDLYAELADHPLVDRIVAMSGGYDLDESCARLRDAQGMIACFSRVLMTGLHADQNDHEFGERLDATVTQIHEASCA